MTNAESSQQKDELWRFAEIWRIKRVIWPYLATMVSDRIRAHEVHERLQDDELVYATLAALRDADSVADFYQKYIRDSRNQLREISDCVSRVSAVLTAEERGFEKFVKKIMAGVRGGVVRLATPTDWHDRTIEMIDGWWLQLGDRVVESVELRERFVVGCTYILRRAVDYVNCGIQVDPNDFEDGRFCQHLALDSQMSAITADSPLRQCLQKYWLY